MKTLELAVALLMLLFIANNKEDNVTAFKIKENSIKIITKNTYLNEVVTEIKRHEGIKYYPYICPGGHLTVGAGHIIREDDNFIYPLTDEQVTKLILEDLKKANTMLEVYTPDSILNALEPNKKWVLRHFIFCKGIGNYNNSTLKKNLLNDSIVEIELKKWCYYHNNGKKIRSKWSYKIRLWEVKLWHRNQ